MNNPTPNSAATTDMPRRDFLKTGVAAAAAAAWANPLTAAQRARSIGANDRIRVAQLGCGSRGVGTHMKEMRKHVQAENFAYVAVADTWRVHREEAAATAKEISGGGDVAQFKNYRDLFEKGDFDAVLVATPDLHHTTHLEAAAKARKHIYIEKPLATEFDKLLRAYDAAKAAQAAGSIIQVGTQLRSFPGIVGARELMKTGAIGKVTRVDETRNSEKPYWYQYLDRDVKEADVEWNEFLGDRKKRPFDAKQYAAWYGYYDFSQGPVPQWGAHFLDLMHYVMDCGFPESCVCLGGVTYWKDENKFTTPDNVMATWMYPEGFIVTSSNNFGNFAGNSRKFYGDKGTLSVDNWNAPYYTADGGPKRDGKIRGKMEVKAIQRPDHWLNWLQCMRDNKTPHASIDDGLKHAVAVLMAVRSYETGKRVTYDHAQRKLNLT